MKFEIICGITIAMGFLQLIMLFESLIPEYFKPYVWQKVFKYNPSAVSVEVLQLIVVTGWGFFVYFFMMLSTLSILKDLRLLQHLSSVFVVGCEFWLLVNLLNAVTGAGTAPKPFNKPNANQILVLQILKWNHLNH